MPGQTALAARLQAEWPRLDILMSNAADVTHLPIEDWTEDAFDRLVDTNPKAPFSLVKALLPLFSPRSSVILAGSVSAYLRAAGPRCPDQRPEPGTDRHQRAQRTRRTRRRAPGRRLRGTPAEAAVYLASDESTCTVGTVPRVDGGIGERAY